MTIVCDEATKTPRDRATGEAPASRPIRVTIPCAEPAASTEQASAPCRMSISAVSSPSFAGRCPSEQCSRRPQSSALSSLPIRWSVRPRGLFAPAPHFLSPSHLRRRKRHLRARPVAAHLPSSPPPTSAWRSPRRSRCRTPRRARTHPADQCATVPPSSPSKQPGRVGPGPPLRCGQQVLQSPPSALRAHRPGMVSRRTTRGVHPWRPSVPSPSARTAATRAS